jgi:hypothetical protein
MRAPEQSRTRSVLGLIAIATIALGALCAGCKEKAADPGAGAGPLDTSEFTGPCKDLLEHVAKVTAPPDLPVADQIKARVAAKVDAKRCQKGTMPEAEVSCIVAAKTKAEIEACKKK